jgi:hypothetical protein
MTAFHRHLQEGMGPAAALRAAQEEVRTNGRWTAPYYWAGVQIIGDRGKWETGEAGRSRRWVLWLGGAVAGLGVAGVALILARRRVRKK